MLHGKVLLEIGDGIAVMTLNDPPVLNAFGAKLRADMSDALDRVEDGLRRGFQHAYETVNLLREGAAARIELNRPESLNAWNLQFGEDMIAACRTARPRWKSRPYTLWREPCPPKFRC